MNNNTLAQNELQDIVLYAIKQTHYGGTRGGLSESECRTIHDCLLTRLGNVNINEQ